MCENMTWKQLVFSQRKTAHGKEIYWKYVKKYKKPPKNKQKQTKHRTKK